MVIEQLAWKRLCSPKINLATSVTCRRKAKTEVLRVMPVNAFWQWNFKKLSIKFNLKIGKQIWVCSGCAVGTNKSSYLSGFMCKNSFLVQVSSAAGSAVLQCLPSRRWPRAGSAVLRSLRFRWWPRAPDCFHLVELCFATLGLLVMRMLKRIWSTVRYHFTALSSKP